MNKLKTGDEVTWTEDGMKVYGQVVKAHAPVTAGGQANYRVKITKGGEGSRGDIKPGSTRMLHADQVTPLKESLMETKASKLLNRISEVDNTRIALTLTVTPRGSTNARNLRDLIQKMLDELNNVDHVDSEYDFNKGIATFQIMVEPGQIDVVKQNASDELAELRDDQSLAFDFSFKESEIVSPHEAVSNPGSGGAPAGWQSFGSFIAKRVGNTQHKIHHENGKSILTIKDVKNGTVGKQTHRSEHATPDQALKASDKLSEYWGPGMTGEG